MARDTFHWNGRQELSLDLLFYLLLFSEEEEGCEKGAVQRDREAESHVCPKTQSWKSKSAAPKSKKVIFQDTEV